MRRLWVIPFSLVVVLVALRPIPIIPIRFYYHEGRPTRWGRFVNATWARIFRTPIGPSFLAELETRGRKSGLARSVPIVIGDYEGEQYVVSMLGERSGWVPNIRAAGGRAAINHGTKRDVQLVE